MAVDGKIVRNIVAIFRRQKINASDPAFATRLLDLLENSYYVDVDDEGLVAAYRLRISPLLLDPRAPPDPKLLSAPFRFVALNEAVAPAATEVVRCGLDIPLPGGFCGTIEVDWAAETPLLIGSRRADGRDGPMRLGSHGPYVIPGATLRGLLRSTCEIVAYGRLWQANRHHRYAVRDFTHPLFGDANRPTWTTLQSGWLQPTPNSPSGYEIVPCLKYLIRIRDLPGSLNGGKPTDNGAFHREWLSKELSSRYQAAGQVNGGRSEFAGNPSAFSLATGRTDQVVNDSSGIINGWFVFAGRSPTVAALKPKDFDAFEKKLDAQDKTSVARSEKKREYVFVDDPAAQPVPLTVDAFARFELAHTKPSRNRREPDGSYTLLRRTLDSGGRIPVFYIGDLKNQSSDFSIGLTRLFKRGHIYSMQDKLNRERAHQIAPGSAPPRDMVEALFGQVYAPGELGMDPLTGVTPADIAWKGRVAFGFALLQGGAARESSPSIETVMMAPRASYAPFYLRGTYKDWSDSAARLAGRKRYFPQYAGATPPGGDRAAAKNAIYGTLRAQIGNNNQDTKSRLIFLEPTAPAGELVFRGTLQLHNVSAAEIGMLLWALTHGGDPAKPYRHMIGRAKTAGAGQVRIKAVRLNLSGNDDAADKLKEPPVDWERATDNREGWTTSNFWSLAPFLCAFEKAMRNIDRMWPNTTPVLELLGCAKPEFGEAERTAIPKRTRYLGLQEFGQLRNSVKLDGRDGAGLPQAADGLLAAPLLPAAELKRPYAT